ncbi:MAG TPA: EutN/CcmL family microcompartment protein [Bacteroidales bacterium]|nr:EutN/CcmL family microcompartment protein [Bacteroidales bacterium]
MNLAKVVGTVVSTTVSIEIDGARYLLVEKTNHYGSPKGDFLVALDLVGANYGELVMISESSSARDTLTTINKAVDAIIVGIIDLIDENDNIIYKKN